MTPGHWVFLFLRLVVWPRKGDESMRKSGRAVWLALAVSLLGLAGADGASIPVGTGSDHAQVYVEFGDGANYTFEVAYNGSVYGMDLLDIIETHELLTTKRVFDGMFIDGMSYDGHSSIGYAGGENWWHYWTRESNSDWSSPQTYGAFDRVVQDGSCDGWIYGRAGSPLPEPATAFLGIVCVAAAAWRRPERRR